jgi:acetyl esterase
MTTTVIAPGRLGNPCLEMRDDPRADPRMIAALAPFGLDGAGAPAPVAATGPRADRLEFALAGEAGFEAVFAALVDGLPEVDVERTTETIEGGDGNPVTLHISRPRGASGPLPGVLHLHGGGMVILQAAGPMYCRIRDELAGHRAGRRGRRVPQRGRGAGRPPVPGGPRRLRQRPGVDARARRCGPSATARCT